MTPRKAPGTGKSGTPRKATATAKTTRSPAKKAGKSTKAAKRAAAPRARTTTAPGKRGPAPLVLRGFTWTPGTDTTDGIAAWAPKTPAAEALAALSVGATWEDAARYARLHHATVRQWNARGEVALGDYPTLDHVHATGPDPETMAYAAFHVAAGEARGAPVLGALQAIDRARASDWRAGAHMLKVLPQAKDYRETTKTQHTGADDGPIGVDIGEGAERLVLDLAERIATEKAAEADT